MVTGPDQIGKSVTKAQHRKSAKKGHISPLTGLSDYYKFWRFSLVRIFINYDP